MKAFVLHSPTSFETNPLVYEQMRDPQPRDDEVLVRVHTCGVCRTDLHVLERIGISEITCHPWPRDRGNRRESRWPSHSI